MWCFGQAWINRFKKWYPSAHSVLNTETTIAKNQWFLTKSPTDHGPKLEQNQENYLILVDYYSNFFEVAKLNSTKTPSIIKNLKTNFARHGIPNVIISDNGPQFHNAEIKQFAKEWKFTHMTSSPHYLKSNGLTERTIQTVKKVLKKAEREGTDPNLAILELRNTPRNKHLGSPVQRLFSRRTKSSYMLFSIRMAGR